MEALSQFLFAHLQIGETQLSFSLMDMIIYLLLPLVIMRIFILTGTKLVRNLTTRFSSKNSKRILKWGKRSVRLLGIGAFLIFVSLFFLEETRKLLMVLGKLLQYPLITNQNTNITILSMVLLIPIIYFSHLIAKKVQQVSERTLLPRFLEDESQRFTIANILRYLLMTIFLLVGLSFIGVNLAGLSLLLGVLGVGIGFGLQGTVENLFAGIAIIVSRPIKQGDRIKLDSHLGDVTHIKLLHTVITTIANETLIVPNRNLVSNVVHNYTHERDRSIMLFSSIQVSYASDLIQVEKLLKSILWKNPYIKKGGKEPKVFLHSFDESGITFRCSSHLSAAYDKYPANSWINFEIWKGFKRTGIEIPFPQMDVHIKNPPAQEATREDHPGSSPLTKDSP